MKEHRYIVNPPLLGICIGIVVVLGAMTGVMIHLGRPWSMAFFGVLTLVFAGLGLHYGAVITVSPRGIGRSILGVQRRFLPWEQIREVGVFGARVIKDPDSKHVGTLYIYFSEKALTEKERFDMILRWPHWNQCYLLFSYDRMRAVQMLWDSDVETYNVGDLTLNEGLKN